MDNTAIRRIITLLDKCHRFLFVLTQPHNEAKREIQIGLLDNPGTIAKLTKLREELRAVSNDLERKLKDTE